ncbi:porin family protein [Kordiimonas pumila]|uniref:Porin n=1 Tax=Kordiimonas pumila TaxID=2161677 RepID=A0ABV7D2T6_9PROT|nr:hypothetical protein [Kordiimonas pumila]
MMEHGGCFINWCISAVLIGFTLPVYAQDSSLEVDIFADARVTVTSGEPTWFNDWLGKGRYGGERDKGTDAEFRLAEVSLLAKYNLTWDLHAFAHVKYDPEQDKPADVVEAYFSYEPVPKSALRYSFKAGLYFPHISRENTGIAWTSPYTITPSAANSWVGEEIRALGIEAKAEYRHEMHRLAFTVGIFGMNDPAGTLLAFRGWGIGDAKVGAFSQVPLVSLPVFTAEGGFIPQPTWVHPVREIDGRPGYYMAADWRYGRSVSVGVFYYDNRGDPEAFEHKQYAWDTRFWNAYIEAEPVKGLKLISQYMFGRTEMGPKGWGGSDRRYLDVNFDTVYLLASQEFGKYRISGRGEWFGVEDNSLLSIDNNNEDGYAFTVALSRKIGARDILMMEYLYINSDRPARAYIGFEPHQENSLLQLSFRKVF